MIISRVSSMLFTPARTFSTAGQKTFLFPERPSGIRTRFLKKIILSRAENFQQRFTVKQIKPEITVTKAPTSTTKKTELVSNQNKIK